MGEVLYLKKCKDKAVNFKEGDWITIEDDMEYSFWYGQVVQLFSTFESKLSGGSVKMNFANSFYQGADGTMIKSKITKGMKKYLRFFELNNESSATLRNQIVAELLSYEGFAMSEEMVCIVTTGLTHSLLI